MLAAALLLVATAASPDRPAAVLPTRDVDITYKVPVPNTQNTALLQRLRWSLALQRERVDMPTSDTWMLLDYQAHTLSMVQDATHRVMDLPAPANMGLPGSAPAASYKRIGPDTVAGLACTDWQTSDATGGAATACYTDDGVLLRARAGGRTLMEAVTVHFSAQDAATFQVPDGYDHRSAQAK